MGFAKRPSYARARRRVRRLVSRSLRDVTDVHRRWKIIEWFRSFGMIEEDSLEPDEDYVRNSARASFYIEYGVARRGRRIYRGDGRGRVEARKGIEV